eukprot:g2433.t1
MLRIAALVATVVVSLFSAHARADDTPAWTVLQKTFSAITIGIAFEDDTTGWTSHTDGSSAINIVKTTDGGQTWNNVANNTGLHVIMMGVAAAKKGVLPITNVATTGVAASEYSIDGDDFKTSVLLTLESQDIDFAPNGITGQMTVAGTNGPCVSHTGGALYECHKVPLKNKGTGRYVATPSKDVVYLTAGSWPASPAPTPTGTFHVSRNLRVDTNTFEAQLGPLSSNVEDGEGYTAELWKSTNGGKNWTNLISDEGAYYFNDIDCFDETHCVAVGEGFGEDGSTAPGARIYVTSDGETFDLVYTMNTTGAESLMAAAMLSETEMWAGGTTKTGGLLAPVLALHSTDGGKTWTNEDNGIIGQMITAFDFVSPTHAYATTVNALQVSSLLEYVAGGPAPAPTPGPAPGQTHYGDPFKGPCESDEVDIQITDIDGKICSPACDASGSCPTDVPSGVTATPQCALKSSTGSQYCALICTPGDDDAADACGENASCKPIQGTGLCTYDS